MITPDIQAQLHTLLLTVLTGIVAILAAVIRNFINAKINNMQGDTQKAIAQRVVAYAEQKLTDNVEKNQYVANTLSAKFPELTPTEIQHLLEEAVMNLQSQPAQTDTTTGGTK